jgi:uncharacterized protein
MSVFAALAPAAGAGFGALLIFGLASSIHCLAMCGGIVAVGSSPRSPLRLLAYNAGRLLSYAAAGAAFGSLGSLAAVSDGLRALVAIVGGLLIAAIGYGMLGLFPTLKRWTPTWPLTLARRILGGGRGSFATGLLTVLLPCAPLQTMLLFSLGLGTAIKGALAMLAFALGTLPTLLGASAAYARLASRPRLSRLAQGAAALLVLAMGLVMAGRGLILSGLPARAAALLSFDASLVKELPPDAAIASLDGGSQHVATRIQAMAFQPIVVQKNLPVSWTISASDGDLNEHSSTFSIPDLGIKRTLRPGDTVVEFTPPDRSGEMDYCSWCAMISSRIYVVDDLGKFSEELESRGGPLGKEAKR